MPFKSVNQVTFDELTDARDREFRHNGYTNYSMATFNFQTVMVQLTSLVIVTVIIYPLSTGATDYSKIQV